MLKKEEIDRFLICQTRIFYVISFSYGLDLFLVI